MKCNRCEKKFRNEAIIRFEDCLYHPAACAAAVVHADTMARPDGLQQYDWFSVGLPDKNEYWIGRPSRWLNWEVNPSTGRSQYISREERTEHNQSRPDHTNRASWTLTVGPFASKRELIDFLVSQFELMLDLAAGGARLVKTGRNDTANGENKPDD